MRFVLCLLLAVLFFTPAFSQDSSFKDQPIVLRTGSGEIHGSLLLPRLQGKFPVALLIAGSGPTDRDGNNPFMKNESLKYLAQALAKNGIATVRFDKRGIAASAAAMKSEADLRFEDYISDAEGWIGQLREDKRFSAVYVIGHSEGALIGMIAAQKGANGFVSLAGPGRPVDVLLKEQLKGQPEGIVKLSYPIIDSLKSGHLVKAVHPMLFAVFRPSVQPYLISLFRYDPKQEIKKLNMPVLIVHGDNDLQVKTEDGEALAAAHHRAKYVLVKDMNHVLKILESRETSVNMAAYNNQELPISEKLVEAITSFINKAKKEKLPKASAARNQ